MSSSARNQTEGVGVPAVEGGAAQRCGQRLVEAVPAVGETGRGDTRDVDRGRSNDSVVCQSEYSHQLV